MRVMLRLAVAFLAVLVAAVSFAQPWGGLAGRLGPVKATSITDTGLTSGRVVLVRAGGLLGDDDGFYFDGTGIGFVAYTKGAFVSPGFSDTNQKFALHSPTGLRLARDMVVCWTGDPASAWAALELCVARTGPQSMALTDGGAGSSSLTVLNLVTNGGNVTSNGSFVVGSSSGSGQDYGQFRWAMDNTPTGSPALNDVLVIDTTADNTARKALTTDAAAIVVGVTATWHNIARGGQKSVNCGPGAIARGDRLVVSTAADGAAMTNNAQTDSALIVGYALTAKAAQTAKNPQTTDVNIGTDTITITAHGWANGQRLVYRNGGGSSIGGLTNATAYYVVGQTTNTIQLAVDVGGAAIDLTSTGNNAQTLQPTGIVSAWTSK